MNARFTKSFGLGGLDMTGYLDIRNLLNFRNVLQVFAVNGDVTNNKERVDNLNADLLDLGLGTRSNDGRARWPRAARSAAVRPPGVRGLAEQQE